MNDLREKVTLFLDHLNLQIEDLNLEAQGISVDLYFDTADIRSAVLGMQAFYPLDRNAIERFRTDKTLVHCLAASGWLGPLHMLPSHQAEFLTHLKQQFGFRDFPSYQFAHQFWERIGVMEQIKGENSRLSKVITEEELFELVRRNASSSATFFKAVQCIRGNWQIRLRRWLERKILHLEAIDVDYNSIVRSRIFHNLRKSFDLRREDLSLNNFADAFAIMVLIHLVEEYKSGRRKSVPRFFTSTGIFPEMIAEAGVTDLLTYQINGRTSNVLRDEDYFIFKAMFRPYYQTPSSVDDIGNAINDLRELQEKITQILEAQRSLEDAVNVITLRGRPLSQLIDERRDLSFFKNVWSQYDVSEAVDLAWQDLVESARQLKSKLETDSFQQAVQEAINEINAALVENTKGYEQLSLLWVSLERATITLRHRIPEAVFHNLDYIRDLGLLQFAFPESSQQQVRDVLDSLLKGNEEREKNARLYVMETYYRELHRDDSFTDDLITSAAILWVLQMNRELIDLLEKARPLPHYSLKLMLTAALFRIQNRQSIWQDLLNDLIGDYKTIDNPGERANLAIGLAYLYFRRWKRTAQSSAWRKRVRSSTIDISNDGKQAIEEAIRYAREAYNLLELDDIKKVYALNQYLYYLVEGGNNDHQDEIDDVADELQAYKSNYTSWQYRYDDTLARYYHRLAMQTSSIKARERFIKIAIKFIEDAKEGSIGDKEVENYELIIEKDYAKILSKKDVSL